LCSMGTPLPSQKMGRSPQIFGPYLLRPNAWMDQYGTWHEGRPQPRRLCVRWGPRSPPQKGGGAPKFSAHIYCGQTPGWIKMVLGMKVDLSPGDFVLDGDPAPSQKRGGVPQFRPMFIAAKRLDGSRWDSAWRWALVQATLCSMGSQLPFLKRGGAPNFRPMSMDQDATWYGGRPRPLRNIVLDGDPAPLP